MPTHLGYWKSVLPLEAQTAADVYVVLPTQKAVIPVSQAINSNDLLALITGEEEIVDSYLRQGAAQYPNGTDVLDEKGNFVLGGHSSAMASDENVFGSIFAQLHMMNA